MSGGAGRRDNAVMTPVLRQVVLDTTDPRGLAEFYRALLGYEYRPGDEPPPRGAEDPKGRDWLVLRGPGAGLAFQYVASLARPVWPDGTPQQLHLDLTVDSTAELTTQHRRALELGAVQLLDRSEDEDEPLYVFADPTGHPFCIFVSPPAHGQ